MLGKSNEMPLTSNLVVELFDVWGIDFMGPFVPSCGFEYILFVVDQVSKWVEAIATQTNNADYVVKFVKDVILTGMAHHELSLAMEATTFVTIVSTDY